MTRVLIVGAGQAGLQLATSLRELGHAGPLTLIGAEPHLPYQRPPLTKSFLAADSGAESLVVRAPAFYAERRIEMIRGERVERVEPPSDGGPGRARTDRGRIVEFDRLALTLGARPRRLDIPGADRGVHYLRGLDDAVALRARLDTARSVVVVGGGFLGLEAAAVARTAGKEVTVIEAADHLLARSVAPEVAEFYRRTHAARGVEIRLATTVAARTDGGVVLSDGGPVAADLVLVSIGVVPRTELAEQAGAACAGGILVDLAGRTSVPGVVAAGDCTVQPDPLTGAGRVRLESVHNAIAQAKAAAASLADRPAPPPEVPWFWSDQYDVKLQIAGLKDGYDDHVLRGDPAEGRFTVLYFRAGALCAVDAVNRTVDYLAARKALAAGTAVTPAAARDVGTAVRDLLRPAAWT